MERDYGYAFMERNEERLFAGEPAGGYSGTRGRGREGIGGEFTVSVFQERRGKDGKH